MAAHLVHRGFIGAYVYALTVDGVVRYIGKGRRYRALEHFRFAREINRRRASGEKLRALPVHNKLAKALRQGLALGYQVLENGLTDEAAYRREAEEIAKAPAGQLWNLHHGGEGMDGEMIRQFWRDPAFRERTVEAQRRSKADPDYRDRARQATREQWADPEFRERWQRQHRAFWDDPERAAERRALLKAVWADPVRAERKRELVKSQWTPERRAAMAENRRRAWADPEFKVRVAAKVKAAKERKKAGL
jgi:hypothetical protein